MDPIPGTLVFLAALNYAFRSTRFRIFPFFRIPLWRPANKATAWPPASRHLCEDDLGDRRSCLCGTPKAIYSWRRSIGVPTGAMRSRLSTVCSRTSSSTRRASLLSMAIRHTLESSRIPPSWNADPRRPGVNASISDRDLSGPAHSLRLWRLHHGLRGDRRIRRIQGVPKRPRFALFAFAGIRGPQQ